MCSDGWLRDSDEHFFSLLFPPFVYIHSRLSTLLSTISAVIDSSTAREGEEEYY